MKSKIVHPLFLAMLFVAHLGLGGCNTVKPTLSETAPIQVDSLTAEARSIISDSNRADAVASLLNELDDLIEDSRKGHEAHNQKMRVLLANFDTTSKQLQNQLENFNQQKSARQAKLKIISNSIRSSTTVEEWDNLKKDIKKTMSALISLSQQP